MSENNVIYGINGPVVTIKGETGLSMMEMVYVGEKRLVGEVIRLDKDLTTIQDLQRRRPGSSRPSRSMLPAAQCSPPSAPE